jgi:hypothetical protein
MMRFRNISIDSDSATSRDQSEPGPSDLRRYLLRSCVIRRRGREEGRSKRRRRNGGPSTRVSSETSFVSYFAKHKTKQVSCFTKQTSCFAKFCYEAKQAVLHVSLFFKRNETSRFACLYNFFQMLSYIKKDVG